MPYRSRAPDLRLYGLREPYWSPCFVVLRGPETGQNVLVGEDGNLCQAADSPVFYFENGRSTFSASGIRVGHRHTENGQDGTAFYTSFSFMRNHVRRKTSPTDAFRQDLKVDSDNVEIVEDGTVVFSVRHCDLFLPELEIFVQSSDEKHQDDRKKPFVQCELTRLIWMQKAQREFDNGQVNMRFERKVSSGRVIHTSWLIEVTFRCDVLRTHCEL